MNLHQVLLKAAEQKSTKPGLPVLPQLLTCNRGISRRRTQTHTHYVAVTKTCTLYFLISAELQSQRGGQVLEQVALRQVRRD